MKKSNLSLFLLIIIFGFPYCSKDDIPVDFTTIDLSVYKVEFHQNKTMAWSTIDGFTIKLDDTSRIFFNITIPDKKPGIYYFTTKEIIVEPFGVEALANVLGVFVGVIHERLYYVKYGTMTITDTTDNRITATFNISGTSADGSDIPFKIENGIINKLPIINLKYNTVNDFEGNQYKTIAIGSQNWMAENLRSTKYSDGSTIKGVSNYSTKENLIRAYGRFYTWTASMYNEKKEKAQGACPTGWHIPSDREWKVLIDYLGGDLRAAVSMKSTKGWWDENMWQRGDGIPDNSSGLTVREAGQITNGFQSRSSFWSSTTNLFKNDSTVYYRTINSYDFSTITRYESVKNNSFSIRCIKD